MGVLDRPWVRLENRVASTEKALEDPSAKVARLEEEFRVRSAFPCVPIQTFAPEPFEVLQPISAVVQADEGAFVATLFDANISSSGDTQEEAVANLKDLILMIFQDFENEDDADLGPAMIRQKQTLLSLIRRK